MENKLNVIIPMAGFGSRFKRAGYSTYKPFIEIQGKKMIDYVLEPFPEDIHKYFIVHPDIISEDEIKYLESKTNAHIINLQEFSQGPSHTIYLARNNLPLDESFFVSYSDIYWTWNWENVKKLLYYDGIIFTRKKWHPHLFKNPNSAFCLPKSDNPNLLQEIKEKGHFTEDHMKEPLSVGVFYYKSGRDMIRVAEQYIKEDIKVNNEFFPTEPYNQLVKEGKQIYLSDVDFFIHLGLPEQLEDFNNWKKILEFTPQKTKYENVCIMGGLGERMQELGKKKALVDIRGLPMFEFVLDQFGSNRNTIVTTDAIAKELPTPKIPYEIINIGKQTKSQIGTIKKAIEQIKDKKNFFMTSCDCYGIFDNQRFENFIEENNPDAIIFTFNPTLMQQKMAGHHTHVSLNGNRITDVHIKGKSSDNDRGLAGFFWFKSGDLVAEVNNLPEDPNNELIADHLLKYLADQGKRVYGYPLDNYVHIGTIPDYKEFKFWENYSSIFRAELLRIAHRVNTIEKLKTIPKDCGIEIDIRPYNGKLILNHEPHQNGIELEEFLKHYNHKTIILNVKSEGIEKEVIALMEKYNITDYFFLDVTFPFIIKLINSETKIAVRFSEFESIETCMNLAGKVDWVFIDNFTHLPVENNAFEKLKKHFKLCIVSPELLKRPEEIKATKELLKKHQVDAVLTDHIELWD